MRYICRGPCRGPCLLTHTSVVTHTCRGPCFLTQVQDMQRMHAAALEKAKEDVEFARKERNALCTALASLAQAAVSM